MEPKKIKKLVLKKEVVSVLNDYAQSKQKGGANTGYAFCTDYTDACPKTTWEEWSCGAISACGPCLTPECIPFTHGCPTPSGYYSFCNVC